MEKSILSYEISKLREILGKDEKVNRIIDSISHKIRILTQINHLLSLAELDLTTKLNTLLDLTMQLVPTEAGSIFLREGEILKFKAARGPKADLVVKFPLRVGEGIAGYVVQENTYLIVPQPLEDSRFARHIAYAVDYIPYNILAVPLRGKEVIGALELLNSKKPFLAEEAELLTFIGGQLATIIENSLLLEEKERRIKNLETLFSANRLLSSTLELDSLLSLILSLVNNAFSTESASILLIEGDNLVFKAAVGKEASLVKDLIIPKDKGIAGWVIKNQEVIFIDDVSKDSRFYVEIDALTGLTTHNIIAAPLKIKDKVIGVLEGVNRPRDLPILREDTELFAALADSAALAIENARLYKQEKEIGFALVNSLACAIDIRDPFTFGHSERVAKAAAALAEAFGCNSEEVKKIRIAALLHDIGKIGISDSILRKRTPLTEEEFEAIKAHPELGLSILSSIPQLSFVIPGILQHHERWNGKGYPYSLCKENISLEARIIAICDTYEALTSNRPYRQATSKEKALEEIERCAGEEFDPQLVKLFIEVAKKEKF